MLENSLNINTLFLTWQTNKDRHQRFLVGMLKRLESGFEFSYLVSTEDYEKAIEKGFMGYPAFPLKEGAYRNDVMATFMKRLPPRSRRDFKKFLVNHHLSETFKGSDFDLITHTGIQLPSDGFDLIPNLDEAEVPFEYLMELAGTRYYLSEEQAGDIDIGSQVKLRCENDNEFDCNAVAVYLEENLIGYVNKLFCKPIRKLMERNIMCSIAQVSGTKDRPLIYVMLSIK